MSKQYTSHIRPFKDFFPELKEGAYVDPAAVVIGDVVLGKDSSVWPLVVIRGDAIGFLDVTKANLFFARGVVADSDPNVNEFLSDIHETQGRRLARAP